MASDDGGIAKKAIFGILGSRFKEGKDVLILDYDSNKIDENNFFIRNSSKVLFIINSAVPEKIIEIKKIIQALPSKAFIAVNFDVDALRSLKNESQAQVLTFGFGDGADIRASDIVLGEQTNFKIDYKGSIVPVWISGKEKELIYAALSGASCGIIMGINLVEISQKLKSLNFI